MNASKFFNPRRVGQLIFLIFSLVCLFTPAFAQHSKKLDVQKLEQILGMKGKEKEGEYKVTVPQHDLDVKITG